MFAVQSLRPKLVLVEIDTTLQKGGERNARSYLYIFNLISVVSPAQAFDHRTCRLI